MTIAMRARVIARDGFVCAYCGGFAAPPHVDHIIPIKQGGTTSLDNLVVACGPCNLAKGARTPDEWLGGN